MRPRIEEIVGADAIENLVAREPTLEEGLRKHPKVAEYGLARFQGHWTHLLLSAIAVIGL